jgi:hypothetical protein
MKTISTKKPSGQLQKKIRLRIRSIKRKGAKSKLESGFSALILLLILDPKGNPHRKQPLMHPTLRWMITFVCFCVLILKSALPGIAQPDSARVSFTPDGPSNAVGMCHVTLQDSTNVQSIEVELTDLMNKEVLLIREYTFDQTTGLPTGITWHREGKKVQMGLGTLPKKLAWQGKVRVKDGSGQWGEAYTFLFN